VGKASQRSRPSRLLAHGRGLIFGAILAACLLLGGGWIVIAAHQSRATTSKARVAVAGGGRLDVHGRVLVRAVTHGDERLNGRVTLVRLGGHAGAKRLGGLACERVYEAGGHGICLWVAASGVDYRMKVFDARRGTVHEEPLTGLPSRARVSPSGRWGSMTTFVSGDAYTSPGSFSTRTTILDMRTGKAVAGLEQFSVEKDGHTIDSPDFNFWGTTFAHDDDTFYATLATGGKTYLVKGSLRERHMRVIHENVECPSLSPDETRIAYKKLVGGKGHWRLHVLDLATGRDVALSERRSIDDQVEWLDDGIVLYGDGTSVWAARADGTGAPEKVLARAASPAVLH
jgi:hypothetical protein